jgi:4-deoxy-L-threo-5-hexosulose-uronate ketol-isomerase
MSTSELRESFLVDGLFAPDAVILAYTNVDRAVLGGAVPISRRLVLEPPDLLRAASFTERRELGVLNLGGTGTITVDGYPQAMAPRDALYIGRGRHQIEFASADGAAPARFYLVSYPAHEAHPMQHAGFASAEAEKLGSARDANRRTIYKYIHGNGIRSCQLVMGFTLLEEGSVWNTMPSHTHLRRSEVYLYFGINPDACVLHLFGPPDSTRAIFVHNEQAVLSPPWSIHSGVGTRAYGFVWAMGGENQEFADMDAIAVSDLR